MNQALYSQLNKLDRPRLIALANEAGLEDVQGLSAIQLIKLLMGDYPTDTKKKCPTCSGKGKAAPKTVSGKGYSYRR